MEKKYIKKKCLTKNNKIRYYYLKILENGKKK